MTSDENDSRTYEAISNFMGAKEIIAGVAVRKLKRKKCILAPLQTLGLRIKALPQLGIGVQSIDHDSILFQTTLRGYIFSEFMGQSLKNVTSHEFKEMLQRKDGSVVDRKLIVEYIAADLTMLFKSTEGKKNLGVVSGGEHLIIVILS